MAQSDEDVLNKVIKSLIDSMRESMKEEERRMLSEQGSGM